MKNRRGVTLIMVAAVLAILAALGTGFYTMTLMATRSAVHYSDSVRGEMMAQAGIQYAIAGLRTQAFKKTEDPTDPWYMVDYLHGAAKGISFPDSPLLHDGIDNDSDGIVDNLDEINTDRTKNLPYSRSLANTAAGSSDRFTLSVSDAASKINVNAGDNLAVMLDNLCRVIGPPLVAANLDAIQPRRWAVEADPTDPMVPLYQTALNINDIAANNDIYYTMTDAAGTVVTNGAGLPITGRPMRGPDGVAIYGDGYAIAGYRARHGAFQNPEDIKAALTYVERNGTSAPDDPLEILEIEVKYAAILDHITTSSWVDTNTVCVGKFEWIHVDTGANKTYAIDRDKSWIIDDLVNDPLNLRGSLRGCYLSIMNGHGAGQLRRILTNGIDWIQVENPLPLPQPGQPPGPAETGFAVTPGPISSYMIVSNEEAMLMDVNGKQLPYSYPDNPPPPGTLSFPMIDQTKADGTLVPNPKMDYSLHPLCIHRAPVNVNTATDKVLEALFLGINVQHGHPLALGTDADVDLLRTKWKIADPNNVQPYLLTPAGLKRIPAASGKVVLNRGWGVGTNLVPLPPPGYDVAYLDNYGNLGVPNYLVGNPAGTMTEAHELAYRIIMARQRDPLPLPPAPQYIDPLTGGPTPTNTGLLRGPFKTYDDLYSRVIKPWDDVRFANGFVAGVYHAARLANMLMANFNSNTDILKFNPNIEWIDRWSRNFTEQEPVMVFGSNPPGTVNTTDVPAADPITASSSPIYTAYADPFAHGWTGAPTPPIKSSQKDGGGNYIAGAYITRSFRYKSDEMIDKTDLNRSTTEFSFDSNGIYEIVSTGQVAKAGEVLAERKLAAQVKVYDVWRETTQEQFVHGTISAAVGNRNDPGKTSKQLSCTGQLARDASGFVEAKGLVTLPEPLLPLKARIVDANGKPNPRNFEAVSGILLGQTAPGNSRPLDAFGRLRQNPYDGGANPIDIPDVLANRILPACYDGQIVLSTNTSSYDPSTGPNGDADTFLASFDGDLDTATCQGNGREQAKWPYSAVPDGTGTFTYTGEGYKHRCVDSIGLLGVLNDNLIASDPGIPLVKNLFTDPYVTFKNWVTDKTNVRWIYPFYGISTALMPMTMGSNLESPSYWNNVTLRMGSLRTDGAYLSAPGVSGNTSTIKYLFSPSKTAVQSSPKSWVVPRHTKLNFQPDSPTGNDVTMWAKTTWHHDDMRNHEFFNPGNSAHNGQCVAYYFQKMGQYKWCSVDTSSIGHCGNRRELNDFFTMLMFQPDSGYGSSIHGGYAGVASSTKPTQSGYHVQPFRWSYLGFRANYDTQLPSPEGIGPKGLLTGSPGDWQDTSSAFTELHYVRPFIDTDLYPETVSTNWTGATPQGLQYRWGYRGNSSVSQTSVWGWVPNANPPYQGWYWIPSQNPPMTVGDARDVVYALEKANGSVSPPPPDTSIPSITDPNPDCAGINNSRAGEGQDVKWVWADPYGSIAPDPDNKTYSLKSFGINNLNFGNPQYNVPFVSNGNNGSNQLYWHYRNMPEDGTYAVIDELKISSRDHALQDQGPDWSTLPGGEPKDRVSREMQLSRYYLPPNPGTRADPSKGGPPTFISQTLLQSLKGSDKLKDTQKVAVVRVSWNVFTPRFMCEYKVPGNFPPQLIKGPFDYDKYNDDTLLSPMPGYEYSVNRPPASAYANKNVPAQSGRGVEVELLQGAGGAAIVLGPNVTFTDPAAINSLGTPDFPVWCLPSDLHYRVRFLYPVDPLVDPSVQGNNPIVDASKQYLLDTPVFDDISVTYFMPPRILAFREVTE